MLTYIKLSRNHGRRYYFPIFFKIVGFSYNKHGEVVDELSFPKSVLHGSHYCQKCWPALLCDRKTGVI